MGVKFTLNELLNNGIPPCQVVPKSENLNNAVAAATHLNMIEMTYLVGLLEAELEAYRATLIDATFNNKRNQ